MLHEWGCRKSAGDIIIISLERQIQRPSRLMASSARVCALMVEEGKCSLSLKLRMATRMQLLAPLAGRKGMSAASHIAEGLVGGVRHRGGRRSAGRSDTLSTELYTQRVRKRDTKKEGSEKLGSDVSCYFIYFIIYFSVNW